MSKKNNAKNTGSGKDKAEANKTIALNRSARHDYHLEARFEAGIAIHSGPVAMMRLDGLLGGAAQVLPVGETVVNALAMQRATVGPHPVTLSIPVLRAVTGAVQPVSRHFVTLPQCAEPLEVCAVDPLPSY